MNIEKMCRECYENSLAHGWYDNGVNESAKLAMIHCEVSEAVEEYRNGRGNYYIQDGKPEGVIVEFVDVIIRCFDFIGYLLRYGKKFPSMEEYQRRFDECKERPLKEKLEPVADVACKIHRSVSFAFANKRKDGFIEYNLMYAALLAYDWICQTGVNADDVIMQKHNYNISRPYRHGGKVI